MVFYIPVIHKCPECGHEMEYSSSLNQDVMLNPSGGVFCPICLGRFISAHVPTLENTGIRGAEYRD